MSERQPAIIFPPGKFIQEELKAREWSIAEMAAKMDGDYAANAFCLEMLVFQIAPQMVLGEFMAEKIGKVFGTGKEVWLNLDKAWRGRDEASQN